jgi:hypothetical protein
MTALLTIGLEAISWPVSRSVISQRRPIAPFVFALPGTAAPQKQKYAQFWKTQSVLLSV